VNRVNLDLKKLLGFKIVANQLSSSKTFKIGAKLGDKIGVIGPKPGSSKPESKNS
jgi:hypothetical protein